MARTLNRLSARAAATLKVPGMHADGGGLYLKIDPRGAKRWVFIFQWRGKRTEMGLGSAADVSVAQARVARDEARAHALAGRNPIDERDRAKAIELAPEVVTFGGFADDWYEARKADWTSSEAQARWKRILEVHCLPLRPLAIDAIGTQAVEDTLRPIWEKIPEMAQRVRGGIEDVLDAAKVKGLRTGDNPARWKGHLKHLLPAPKKLTRGHHAAVPYADMPALLVKLRAHWSTTARLLEFTILTAARPTEAREAVLPELDLKAKVWTVPAVRMKEKREHRVPLSPAAVALIESLELDQAFVFPGAKEDRPMSGMTGGKLLDAMGYGAYTVHGFRSSFSDWAHEMTDFPNTLVEAALAHLVGDETERAYKRGDALERRRKLMEAWAHYLAAPTPREGGDGV